MFSMNKDLSSVVLLINKLDCTRTELQVYISTRQVWIQVLFSFPVLGKSKYKSYKSGKS